MVILKAIAVWLQDQIPDMRNWPSMQLAGVGFGVATQ